MSIRDELRKWLDVPERDALLYQLDEMHRSIPSAESIARAIHAQKQQPGYLELTSATSQLLGAILAVVGALLVGSAFLGTALAIALHAERGPSVTQSVLDRLVAVFSQPVPLNPGGSWASHLVGLIYFAATALLLLTTVCLAALAFAYRGLERQARLAGGWALAIAYLFAICILALFLLFVAAETT